MRSVDREVGAVVVVGGGRGALALLGAIVLGCGSVAEPGAARAPEPGGGEPTVPARGEPVPATPERSRWALPEGGVSVDSLPGGDTVLRQVDAFGNLWLTSCGGLYVVSESGIQRYRYLDTPWETGGDPLFADRQGRVWYVGRTLSVLEAGEWHDVVESTLNMKDFVVGADGVAWMVEYVPGASSGHYTMRSVWPEAGPLIDAPRWQFEMFPGRSGDIWYRTLPTLGSELYHFDGRQFDGPFTIEGGSFFYDSVDDSMGIALPEHGDVVKVRFDGGAIVETSRSPRAWFDALGRESSGHLVVRNDEYQLALMDGDRQVPAPFGDDEPRQWKLSATGELYFSTDRSISRYHDGNVSSVIELSRYEPEPRIWEGAGYGAALRAPSTPASKGDFEPIIPAIFGQKVQVTGFTYFQGYEGAPSLVVDGELANVSANYAPELYALFTEHGLDPVGEEDVIGTRPFPADTPPWDLYGYLEPGPCYRPGEKFFQVVEAYPQAMPANERAALEAELRERHAP